MELHSKAMIESHWMVLINSKYIKMTQIVLPRRKNLMHTIQTSPKYPITSLFSICKENITNSSRQYNTPKYLCLSNLKINRI